MKTIKCQCSTCNSYLFRHVILSGVSSNGLTTPLTCHFYTNNTKECTRTGSCIKTNTTCIAGEYCYAIWTNDSHGVFITHQGCWLDSNAECDRTACNFGTKLKRYSAYFCCCNTDYCNEELSVAPEKPIRGSKGTLPGDVCKLEWVFVILLRVLLFYLPTCLQVSVLHASHTVTTGQSLWLVFDIFNNFLMAFIAPG